MGLRRAPVHISGCSRARPTSVPALFPGLVLILALVAAATPAVLGAVEPEPEYGALRDYCQFESFNATCPRDTVILMKTARYGRMRVGKCVRGDYGYIGCASSVLRSMDQECSGRTECRLEIPELEEFAKPCPEDFKSYLEASFQCVKVATGTRQECRENHSVLLDQDEYGYLASFITERSAFGSAACPWTIRVQRGQHIRLRFYNFLPVTTESIDPRDDESDIGCPLYAVVTENGKTVDLNLCDQTEREGYLFTSEGNEIQVYFNSPIATGRVPKFMLQYKAMGCPDIRMNAGGMVKRTGDNAMIKCNQTQETWYVTCKDNKWIGDVGNCTKGAQSWRTGSVLSGQQPVPHGIVMAVVIGILLGVVIGTILLAVVFTCRRHRLLLLGKKDPLAMLKDGDRAHRASQGEAGGKDAYKFTRENSKTSKHASVDYSYRQQSRPLISRQAEFDFNSSTGGRTVTEVPGHSNTTTRVVSEPPPYCLKKWNGADIVIGGGNNTNSLGHHHLQHSRIHDYESPKALRCPRSPRDSLPSPAPGDPPVYFELDPEGNSIAVTPGSMMGNVGTHGSMVALGPDDEVQELR